MSRKKKKKIWKNNSYSLSGVLLVGIFIAYFAVVVQGRLFGYRIESIFSDKLNYIEKIIPTQEDLKRAGYSNIRLSDKQPGIWGMIKRDSIPMGKVISSSFFRKRKGIWRLNPNVDFPGFK